MGRGANQTMHVLMHDVLLHGGTDAHNDPTRCGHDVDNIATTTTDECATVLGVTCIIGVMEGLGCGGLVLAYVAAGWCLGRLLGRGRRGRYAVQARSISGRRMRHHRRRKGLARATRRDYAWDIAAKVIAGRLGGQRNWRREATAWGLACIVVGQCWAATGPGWTSDAGRNCQGVPKGSMTGTCAGGAGGSGEKGPMPSQGWRLWQREACRSGLRGATEASAAAARSGRRSLAVVKTRRIGEAANPGPAGVTTAGPRMATEEDATAAAAAATNDDGGSTGAAAACAKTVDASWIKAVNYPMPHRDGFRGAVAPGLECVEEGRTPRCGESIRLRIEAVNSTGWGPLRRRLESSEAHAILAQETWVLAGQIPSARKWAKRRGWISLWAPAATGASGGACGGVGIFVRKDIGLRGPDVGSHIVADARAVLGVMEAPGHRAIVLASVYLQDGAKLRSCNDDTLYKMATAINAQGPGYVAVCGGDWQNPPEAIARHGAMTEMRTRVVAAQSARGTFRTSRTASELDFFVISECLTMVIDSVELREGTGIKGHVPVQLTFVDRPVGRQSLAIRAPPRLPVERIFGPLEAELDWGSVEAATEAAVVAARTSNDKFIIQKRIDEAYSAWFDMAEADIIRATGARPPVKGVRGKLPRIVWRAILPEYKKAGKESRASLLTWVRGTAQEVLRITRTMGGRVGEGMFRDPPFRGGNMPSGGTFSTPVRGGYGRAPRAPADGAQRGGRPRPVCDAARCIDVLREIIEELAEEAERTSEEPEVDAYRQRVATAARAALGEAIGIRCDDVEGYFLIEDAMETMITEISEAEGRAEKERDRAAVEGWKHWLEKDFKRGARNAHRATKLDEEENPTAVRTAKGTLSANPMDFLRFQREKYRKLWNAAEEAFEYDWEGAIAQLPRLTVDEIRSASASFKESTASAFDGIHVRAYRLVSDRGLAALATLLAAVECSGRWPSAARLTTITLIDKRLGGHRGVGNLTSIYRIWSKARRHYAQRWEDTHHRTFFASARGVGPIDVVYRQAVKQEAATASGLESAVVLDDLESFYETISRDVLISEAQELAFPMAILRASLGAYAGPRMLTLDGRAARELYAREGIIPGCTFATTYVKIFYVRRLDQLTAALPPQVTIDMYIDDAATSAEGEGAEVINIITEAREKLRETLTVDLGCRIAGAKTRVVASSASVSRGIAKRLDLPHAVRRSAPNLGVDATAGARRRVIRVGQSMRKARLGKGTARGRKLAKIARALGTRAVKIFTAGVAPEANYGAEVWGVSDAEAVKLRKAAGKALRPWSRCRSLTAVHVFHGLPACKEELRTVLHYAKQVWRASTDRQSAAARGMSLPDLRRHWEAAHEAARPMVEAYRKAREDGAGKVANKSARRAWDEVRGPISAAALTLARVGWRFKTAFTLEDAHGDEVGLTTTSPAMLAKLLVDAAKDEGERAVGRLFARTDHDFIGRRACVDLAVKAVKEGRRNGMSLVQAGALRAAACNGTYTRSRAVADGYSILDECPKCGARGDTPHHRIYGCPETEESVRRVVPRWLYEEGRRANPLSRFWTTAVFPHPGDDWPKPPAVINGHWTFGEGHEPGGDGSDAEAAQEEEGLGEFVYGDGSCEPNEIRGLSRAAVAVLQADGAGSLVRAFSFPLPRCFPQTSQASEYVMLAQARRLLNQAADLYSDCWNVVRAANGSLREALAPGKLYAGINLDKWQMSEKSRLVKSVNWVKAHRTLVGDEDELTRRHVRANAEADRLAKAAVSLHPKPTAVQRANLEFYVRRAPLVAKAIATALAQFPAAESTRMRRAAAPRSHEEAERRQLHWWQFDEQRWRCRICGKWATSPDLGERHRDERCHGPKAENEAKGWTAKGHSIAMAKGAMSFAYCTRCGAWGNRRALKLRTNCTAPTAAGMAALKNIIAGRHPWRKKMPDGRDAPRSNIRVIATYVPSADAWAAVETTTADAGALPADGGGRGDDAAQGGGSSRGSAPQTAAAGAAATATGGGTAGGEISMGGRERAEDGAETFAMDDDDPFGHGGSLDMEEGHRAHNDGTGSSSSSVHPRADAGGGAMVSDRDDQRLVAVEDGRAAKRLRTDGTGDGREENGEGDTRGDRATARPAAPMGTEEDRPEARARLLAVKERVRARFMKEEAASEDAAARPRAGSGARGGVNIEDAEVMTAEAAPVTRAKRARLGQATRKGEEPGRLAGDKDDTHVAKGKGTVHSAVGACAGPGGPCLASDTAAVSQFPTDRTAAVASRHGAATLPTRINAREGNSERGEAAIAPPQRVCRLAGRLH